MSAKTQGAITLKGSTQIVSEFFGYSINSILYQRGVYPPESFTRVQKYGLGLFVTSDDKLKTYISGILSQLNEWLMNGRVRKLVLVLSGVEPQEVLERWVFDIETDMNAAKASENVENGQGAPLSKLSKSESDVRAEIGAIMRQISASVTFLPLLQQSCTFDILIYTDKELSVPMQWEESAPRCIQQSHSEEVRLRSFDSGIHRVDALVSYRLEMN